MSRNRNREEFRSHLAAESAFAAAELSRIAGLSASLAAEARRLLVPVDRSSSSFCSSSSPFEDSEPERIGEFFFFTRSSDETGSCALLRKKVSGNEKVEELVVDVAKVASSQNASSLGQIKLSPCGRAVAMTLDVGRGKEAWRAVVVEAGRESESERENIFLGSVDGVSSVEWGGKSAFPPPSVSSSSNSLSLPPLFYTRGGAGEGKASTLHFSPWDESARKFRFEQQGSEKESCSRPPLFSEPDSSRVLALGRSKDGALLTLASASVAGSAAYALWLPRADSVSSTLTSDSISSSSLPFPPRLTCVAPFQEGVEHYLEHCDGIPGGLVVMTTATAAATGEEKAEGNEFWLAAPLADSSPSLPPSSIPPPSSWKPLLPPRSDAVLTDIDVFRDSILCYERCSSTGRPQLSLLKGFAPSSSSSSHSTPQIQKVALPCPGFLVVRPGANADPDAETARLTLSGPLEPPRDFDLNLGTGKWSLSSSSSSSSSTSFSSFAAAEELEVASERTRGGVPVTLVRRKNHQSLPRPALLSLYGCYGLPVEPDFDPCLLTLAARFSNFDLAFAHLRGGGELGRKWHAAGRGGNRGRVVEDAREVLRWLGSGGGGGGSGSGDEKELRRPVALVAESAGVLVAGALLADPEASRILSAISLRVPFVDVLGGIAEEEDGEEGEEGGEGGEEGRRRQRSLLEHERGEFASSTSAASALAAVCPYFLLSELEKKKKKSKTSLPGPPVLVTLAENDARVPAAGVAKWVARLRRLRGGAQNHQSRVLLRVLRDCGHAEGLKNEGDIEANALEAAFLVDATERWKEEELKTEKRT